MKEGKETPSDATWAGGGRNISNSALLIIWGSLKTVYAWVKSEIIPPPPRELPFGRVSHL